MSDEETEKEATETAKEPEVTVKKPEVKAPEVPAKVPEPVRVPAYNPVTNEMSEDTDIMIKIEVVY